MDVTRFMLFSQELCSIDLTSCNSDTSPSTVDVCYCVNKVGNEYSLYVRRRPRLSQSGMMLKAVLPSRNTCLPTPMVVDIGVLPVVHGE